MMKRITLGLLVCDHVAERFRPIDGDYTAIFATLFERIEADVEWRIYDVSAGEFPSALDECDGYVTTGSRASAYDQRDWILRLKEMVRDLYRAGIPLIGICFGHQVVAEALGGMVAPAATGWGVGLHGVTIAPREDWMEPFASTSIRIRSSSSRPARFCSDAVRTARTQSTGSITRSSAYRPTPSCHPATSPPFSMTDGR